LKIEVSLEWASGLEVVAVVGSESYLADDEERPVTVAAVVVEVGH